MAVPERMLSEMLLFGIYLGAVLLSFVGLYLATWGFLSLYWRLFS